jgi:allantoin racemase
MKLLWIDPVGTDAFDLPIAQILEQYRRKGTVIDVVSLPPDRPKHLEYHSYEGLVIGDIVNVTRKMSADYDAIVIGCFYDVGLREAREVSRKAVVTAPCQSALMFASQLGNSFSVIVGREKWISKMSENVHLYGLDRHLASMRSVKMGVHDFQVDHDLTASRLMEAGRRAVEEDLAEVLILGCTIEFGFYEKMQQELGVPVIDAVLAPFKMAELMAETAGLFGWYPSRMWGSEAPPEDEVAEIGYFTSYDPVYSHTKGKE